MSGCTPSRVLTRKSHNFSPDSYKRIAIFRLEGDETGAVADVLTTEFLAMGYDVVERSSINAILKEMKLEASGLIDPATAKSVAFAEQAEAVVLGSVGTTLGGRIYFLNLRFIDIATGEIVWSSNYLNKELINPRGSILSISKSIQGEISAPIAASKIDPKFISSPRTSARLSLTQNFALPGKKYKRVALIPMGGTHIFGEDDAVYGALITNLVGGGVEMAERKELESILKEQIKGTSGIYSPVRKSQSSTISDWNITVTTASFSTEIPLSKKNLSDIGRIAGVDALLLGSFQPSLYNPFDIAFASLRVLDLDTGKIAWSASYYNNSVSMEDHTVIANWFSIALAPIITAENRQDYFRKYDLAIENQSWKGSPIIEKLSPEKLAKKKK